MKYFHLMILAENTAINKQKVLSRWPFNTSSKNKWFQEIHSLSHGSLKKQKMAALQRVYFYMPSCITGKYNVLIPSNYTKIMP